MLFKRLSAALILLLVIGFAGGCDELLPSEGDDSLAALVGTWISSAHQVTNNANTSQHVNLYAAGVRLTLTIDEDGNYVHTWTDSGGTEIDSGTLTVDGSTMTVNTGTEIFDVSYLVIAGILTITDANSFWDFDNDGTDDSATEITVFQQPDSGDDLSLTDLVGSFKATHFVATDKVNPSNSEDMIAMGGFFTMRVDGTGATTVIIAFPDNEGGAEILTGTSTLLAGGDSLFTDFPGTEGDATVGLQVVGSSIILARGDVTWNFGAGEVQANLTINLEPITELVFADLDGYWTATQMLLSNPENPGQTLDTMSEKLVFTLGFTTPGQLTYYDYRYRESDDDTNYVDVGTNSYSIIGNIIIMSEGDEQMVLQATLTGGDLVLRMVSEEYDWDQDGNEDAAIATMTFESVTETSTTELIGAWVATHWTYVDPTNPAITWDAIENHETTTMVVEAGGSFEIVQSRPEEGYDRFGGTIELYGNIMRIDDGQGNYMYALFSISSSAFEFSVTDFTDPFGEGTSRSWRTDARLVPFTPAVSADFEGDWTASKFEFTNLANATETYDMIADGGEFDMTIAAGGTFSFSFVFPDQSTENSTGTWEIFGDVLIITDDADSYISVMQYTTGTDTFTMFSNDDGYDFDEDGVTELALLEIVMVPPGL